ncbi:MAG: hypothetical protein OXL96_26120 [Candidatus Poribacteria bacterium]|nr:hypothetical protein [Candidatus Poribacteria bacterium]
MGRHIEELCQELLNDHWRHCYNWKEVSPVKLAKMRGCSADDVRSLMLDIQKAHPKPRRKGRRLRG